MISNWKFRSGFLALLCGFFVLGTASFCFAEDGEPEMTQADSIKKAGQHLSFGARYLKSKQYEDAETQFLKSWGLNPKRATTARYLGRLYRMKEKNMRMLFSGIKKLLNLSPLIKYTRGVHKVLSSIYEILEQPDKAIEAYEALLSIRPRVRKNN